MKRQAFQFLWGVLLTTLAAYAAGRTPASRTHPMDGWIHASVQGEARQVMRRELVNLPPELRETVTFVALDGRVYVNTPRLEDLELYLPTKKAHTYAKGSGERVTLPPHGPQQTPTLRMVKPDPDVFTRCQGTTGAYRQMFTKEGGRASGIRYTYIAADFHVRGGDERTIKITDPDKDVAFVFLGGNGTNGWWLDAGLQYSPLRKDWALFIWDTGKALKARSDAFKLERRASPTLSRDERFAPEQTISVEMFVPQKPVFGADRPMDNRVAVIARGRQRDNDGVRGEYQTRSYILEVPGGWPRDGFDGGRGINLRHTVSLAQVGAMDVTTGSYFKETRITNTFVGSSYATRRPLRTDDILKICAFPNAKVVQARGAAVDIVYDPEQWPR